MRNSVIILSSICCMALSSCANKLEITPPNNIIDEQIKEILASDDEEEIKLVMGSIANGMPLRFKQNSVNGINASDPRYYDINGLNYMRNLEGNDIVLGTKTTNGFGGDEYKLINIIGSDQVCTSAYWYWAWSNITAANKMLNLLDDEDAVSGNKNLQDYKARGLAVRAYSYNFLMENYQDAYTQGGDKKLGIMLYDVYSPTQAYKARSSAEETYEFIKKDINQAITLFESAGIGYTSDLTDIDMAVAKFVLARVSLVTGDWSTTIAACDDILSHYTTFIPESSYGGQNSGTKDDPYFRAEDNAFVNNAINPEAIIGWPVGQASTLISGNNPVIYSYWLNCFGIGSGGSSGLYARIDNRLYERIADDDFRKNAFLSSDWGDYAYPPDGESVFIPAYTNIKYASTNGMGSEQNDKTKVGNVTDCYMRSSEVLLMKAEAQAQAGKEADAKATLNILLAARTKAGATTLTCDNYPSMSGMSALDMVKLQTRIEMWGEKGLEFYNNKRWNIAVDRTSSDNHTEKITYPVSGMTLQIPDDEMFYNPLCVQN